ncbi:MAG TPA: histidine kinase [Bryobacteraceae bacterium]|nr:histidine kinase [Bryobacteraceae bacterium]
MHPLLASKGRIALYLLAWLPVGSLLGYLLWQTGNLTLVESASLALPLALFYAFVCLAPWYLLPLGWSNVPKLVANHTAAGVVAGLLWIVLAKVLGLGLTRYFPRLNERFSPQLPLVFGFGVLLYLLAVALNYVLVSVASSKEAETREQEARTLAKEAEIKALKAQINPHFLFNSLNSIAALATVDGVRAREMCIKLSDFLRSTLSMGDKSHITWREELALAKAYLDVEQVRFGARLRIELDTDANCENCVVPPLFLQPLVENAVKHGVAGLVAGGTVRLEAHCSDGLLRVKVENEFDPDAPAARRHGLGLQNVRNRLRALYENQARIDTVVANNRFLVEVDLPYGARQFWEGAFERLDAVLDKGKPRRKTVEPRSERGEQR